VLILVVDDDFRVLMDLVQGAGQRLRKGGELWIVAQEHVPVGGLLADFTDVSCPVDDGRFVVWHAAGWQGPAVDEEVETYDVKPKRRKISATAAAAAES